MGRFTITAATPPEKEDAMPKTYVVTAKGQKDGIGTVGATVAADDPKIPWFVLHGYVDEVDAPEPTKVAEPEPAKPKAAAKKETP